MNRLATATVALYAFTVLSQFAWGLYYGRRLAGGEDAPGGLYLLYAAGLVWSTAWWMRADARRRGFLWVFDMGLFLYVLWPFLPLYYLLKTRGLRRGFGAAALYAGVYVLAYLLGVLVFMLLAV